MRRDGIRICRIATYPRRGREGAGGASFELSRRITHPTLYITRKAPGMPLIPPPHVRLHEIGVFDPALPWGEVGRIQESAALLRKVLSSAIFLFKSLPAMTRFRPDIVHIHSIIPVFNALAAKLVLRSKIVLTFHGSDVYRLCRWPLVRVIPRLFDHVFYVSRSMEPFLAKMVERERTTYTPNGVDTSLFPEGEGRREKVILSAGVLKVQKGFCDLLRAFSIFSRLHPEYRLHIAGAGREGAVLRRLAADLGLEGAVKFCGQLPRQELAREYRQARVFVISSRSEGFPKVILEALASGTPVVCTDVGSCAEVIEGCGLVVKAGAVEELAAALVRMVEDEGFWEECRSRCRRRAEEYDWNRAAQKVRETMVRLLEEEDRGAELSEVT